MKPPVPLPLPGSDDGMSTTDTPLASLDALAARARFAFVGEMDHFVEEKLAARLHCLRYLVSRGWTVIAEEWPADRGRRADTFLRTGDISWLEPPDEPPWFTSGVLAEVRQPTEALDDAHRRFMVAVRRTAPDVHWYGIDADSSDAEYLDRANAAATVEELRPAMALRERIMHRRIEQIAADHPGERIALFGAALHLLRNDDLVETPGVGAGPGGGAVHSVGHHVTHDVAVGPVLSIWILHGRGRSANPWLLPPGRLTPAPGTVDAELSESLTSPAFVDVAGDRTVRTVTQMHNLVLRCRLADQVDGLVFVPRVHPLGEGPVNLEPTVVSRMVSDTTRYTIV